jgi:uncharacterized peroxidase-related enzyme
VGTSLKLEHLFHFDVRDVMDATKPLLPSLPENATWFDLDKDYRDLWGPIAPVVYRVMRGPSPLSTGERELIATYVSGLNRCRMCFGSHLLVARDFGTDETMLRNLIDNVETAPVDERLKPLLRYVRKLTKAPSRLTPEDADAVFAAGWSERALVHAIAVCALFNYVNRFADGTGIVGTPEIHAMMARSILTKSYAYRGQKLFRVFATVETKVATLLAWLGIK